MLSIRMQRLGRKGHPTYRVVVQDSRLSPTSGKYVALLGSYDPHTKQSTLQKDKAEFYLKNGAQPSDRVASLFKTEKVDLPKWVKASSNKKRDIKNIDKLRRNRPAEEAKKEEKPAAENDVAEAPVADEPEAPVEIAQETADQTTEKSDQAAEAQAETKNQEAEKAEEVPEKPADAGHDTDKV